MHFSRREWLQSLGSGFGTLALAGVLREAGLVAAETAAPRGADDLAPRSGHFPGKAKAVIQLFQNGGPSQIELAKRMGSSQSCVAKMEAGDPSVSLNLIV